MSPVELSYASCCSDLCALRDIQVFNRSTASTFLSPSHSFVLCTTMLFAGSIALMIEVVCFFQMDRKYC